MSATREGCCADWPKPCTYHDGWEDGFDAAKEAVLATLRERREEEQRRLDVEEPRWAQDLRAYDDMLGAVGDVS